MLVVSIWLEAKTGSYVWLTSLARPKDHIGACVAILLRVVLTSQVPVTIPLLQRLIVGRIAYSLIYRLHFLLHWVHPLIFIETDTVRYIFVSCALPERAKGPLRSRWLLP